MSISSQNIKTIIQDGDFVSMFDTGSRSERMATVDLLALYVQEKLKELGAFDTLVEQNTHIYINPVLGGQTELTADYSKQFVILQGLSLIHI